MAKCPICGELTQAFVKGDYLVIGCPPPKATKRERIDTVDPPSHRRWIHKSSLTGDLRKDGLTLAMR